VSGYRPADGLVTAKNATSATRILNLLIGLSVCRSCGDSRNHSGEAGGARPVTVSVVVNVTGGGFGPRTVSVVTTVDGGGAGRVLVKVEVTVQVIVTGGGGDFVMVSVQVMVLGGRG